MPYTDKQLRTNQAIMQRGEALAVELRTHEDERAAGTVRLLKLSPKERGKRGRKFMFTCFLLAPVTAVAPPHVLWLLGTLMTGIVGYFVRKRQRELVLGGQAHCPECGAFQLLEANSEFPFTHFCSECRKRSVVSVTDTPVAAAVA